MRLTHDQRRVLAAFEAVHGARYDYSAVSYAGSCVPVQIICREHGPFWQKPPHHKSGQGCPKCGLVTRGAARRKSASARILHRFRRVHGDTYDYSSTVYRGNNVRVTIICREHGPFRQLPHNHYNGKGCPDCAPNAAAFK